MFRIAASTHTVNGELQYHIRLYVRRGSRDCVCGIITLRRNEWPEFLKLCQNREVSIELQTKTTESCATE